MSTAPQQIEPDPNISDGSDSALGENESGYTASVTSSITNYVTENGRRYHAYKHGTYIMPNDEDELARLDLLHEMVRIVQGDKLYLAPLEETPKRVLDVGTGTGIWAIEMADEHPLAEVTGTDLSPTQPNWVPPNVKFEVDDCEETWTFQEKFDYIHCRYLAGAIQDWPKLMSQVYKNTKPGGWVEFSDYASTYYSEDGSLSEDHALKQWNTVLLDSLQSTSRDPSPGLSLHKWVTEAGFENITEVKYKLPIGPWPKDKHLKTIGAFNITQTLEGLEAFSFRIFTGLGWRPEEVQVLLATVRQDLRNNKIHALFDLHVVYAQKPKAPTTTDA